MRFFASFICVNAYDLAFSVKIDDKSARNNAYS